MKRRKRGFCAMCRPLAFVYRLRKLKVPKYDRTCIWCGGFGVIPYIWRKGDMDRRRLEDRRHA